MLDNQRRAWCLKRVWVKEQSPSVWIWGCGMHGLDRALPPYCIHVTLTTCCESPDQSFKLVPMQKVSESALHLTIKNFIICVKYLYPILQIFWTVSMNIAVFILFSVMGFIVTYYQSSLFEVMSFYQMCINNFGGWQINFLCKRSFCCFQVWCSRETGWHACSVMKEGWRRTWIFICQIYYKLHVF